MENDFNHFIYNLGLNIKKYRILRNQKQEILSTKLDISTVTLSKIENGKVDVQISTLFKISRILGINLESLFHDPGEMIH